MALRIGIALLGITLFSWLVSYYSSKEQPSTEDSKNRSSVLFGSFLLGKNAEQPDYEGLGHEDGGGDEDGE